MRAACAWAPFARSGGMELTLACTERGLCRVWFGAGMPLAGVERDDEAPLLREAVSQLNAYLDGRLREFHVPLDMQGTPFQLRVWNALLRIPYGETRSYLHIAQVIGEPKACRAVGAANGANPIPIIVPCHRVIGSNGSLTGFGGGIVRKRELLSLEQSPRLF